MRLFEHDEFEQAMLRTAEHFTVSEQFIEKDYYVTEILRIVADVKARRDSPVTLTEIPHLYREPLQSRR